MQTWLKQLQFITPHALETLKKYDRDMLRLRNRKQIKNHDPNQSAFLWKYRIHDVKYEVTDPYKIVFTLVDTTDKSYVIDLHELIGCKTPETLELYKFLHDRDRFIVALIIGDLAGREAKKYQAMKDERPAASVTQLGKQEI
ncbi:MAG: hypothetical protein ACK4PR_01580 [Gammaproteobacteria bacterium]